jgi:signal transduction histidine kinase
MNEHLKTIFDFIQQNENLTAEEKDTFSKAVKDVDKELAITAFKLDRTEKVKRTTAILLEETIEELEQKRKAVEAQNRDLEIEASLERVRVVALSMQNPAEMVEVCRIISEQLEFLKVKDIRNIQTAVIDESKGTYVNYEYYARHDKLLITEVSYKTHHLQEEFAMRMLQGAGEFFSTSLIGPEVKDWYEYQKTTNQFADSFLEEAQTLNYYMFSLGPVALGISTYSPLKEEEINLFKRFRNVFELAYRRFLDIQKAEAQARESQIEASVERVRAKSMGMYQTSDLYKVNEEVLSQLYKLKVDGLTGVSIYLVDENDIVTVWDLSSPGNMSIPNSYSLKYDAKKYPVIGEWVEIWKSSDQDYFVLDFPKETLQNAVEEFKEIHPEMANNFKNAIESGNLKHQWNPVGRLSDGLLSIDLMTPPTEDTKTIVIKMAGAFNMAYQRFLDLQKAEAQACEARIEAALERIRSNALAMHNSSEVGDVSDLLFSELEKMDINPTGFSIMVFDREQDKYELWRAKEVAHQGVFETFSIKSMYDKLDQHLPGFTKELESKWNSGSPFFIAELSGKKRISFLEANREMGNYTEDQFENVLRIYPDPVFWQLIFFKHGWLGLIQNEQLPDDDLQVIRRFADVFEFAYTRFLDLQKAESQAREAQIEAALERVRSKTMAMYNSQDVGESVAILFDELVRLEVKTNRCGILIHGDSANTEVWTAKSNAEGKAVLIIGNLDMTVHPMLSGARNSWVNKESSFSYELAGEDIRNYYQAINDTKYYPTHFNLDDLPAREFHSDFYFAEGSIFAFTAEPIPSETTIILKRFAGVFGQTYRRYLDLQKAEAQAREAQIEAALEKVRSRSLAMHKSDELQEVVFTVLLRLKDLNIKTGSTNILIFNENKQEMEQWVANDMNYAELFKVPYGSGYYPEEFFNAKINVGYYQKNYSAVENRLKFEIGFAKTEFSRIADERKLYLLSLSGGTEAVAFGKNAAISLYRYEFAPFTNDEINVLQRFVKVFEQTYTRFLDLKKAEVQAIEAIKASSLDRVRGEIASMRTVDDLQRITPIIWHELIALGVPFVRCGVFIINESNAHIQVFLSSPEGKSLAAMDLPFDSSELTINSVNHWRKGLIFKTHWNKQEFLSFMQSMIKEGQVESQETYQGASAPPESLDLHFVPFAQGMLYVGNILPLTNDELDLVKSLAEAFSIAYARYEDFKKLEIAKQSIEITLSELKAAQSQLVQSEKMASLGELTAGIAHEIQNPLNFVNNFSEVSTELLIEMKDELVAGNWQLATELADDVKQNLEKINHHGKRAADIVKGMLQHSRNNSGTKEPTNINTLADEYLRLAYHGLRAKDKSFNATMKTDFDETIGKIDIIPQDIGRVILNLITNAFYAVNEKKHQAPPPPEGGIENPRIQYEPTVTVSTKLMIPPAGGMRGASISVRDNGSGIPQKVLDKIFQPFFTTKPTGQGTGLGLSLAYDIVKAHGGELKVETKEGEGSEFIIQIPNV